MQRVLLMLACATTLGSCESVGWTRGWCVTDDAAHQWSRLHTTPANAATLRHMADEHTSFHFASKRELWFGAQDGSVMLCRLSENTAPQHASAGESWEFDSQGALVSGEENGWVTAY